MKNILNNTILLSLAPILFICSCSDKEKTKQDERSNNTQSQSNVGRQVTLIHRGSIVKVSGRIEQEQGNRVQVSITSVGVSSDYGLKEHGYPKIFQGDTVWTPKHIWSMK